MHFLSLFVIHLRNAIDFLYGQNPRETDLVALDFIENSKQAQYSPQISLVLQSSRLRANKEVGHLTTERKEDADPNKPWEFLRLVREILPTLKLFTALASPCKLEPGIAAELAKMTTN